MHPNACFWETGPYNRLLVRSISDDEQLVEYQLQLLIRFKPEFILPAFLRYRSGEPQICVDTVDMKPLDESMSADDLCPETGRRYLSQIIAYLIDADEHLLPPEQFALQPSMIFLNSDRTPYLIFWPIQKSSKNMSQECCSIPDDNIDSMVSFFCRSFHFCEDESTKLQQVCQTGGVHELAKILQIVNEKGKNDTIDPLPSRCQEEKTFKRSKKTKRSLFILLLSHVISLGLFIFCRLNGFQQVLWMTIVCLAATVILLIWDVHLLCPNIVQILLNNIQQTPWRQMIGRLFKKNLETGNPENQTVLLSDHPEDFRMAMLSEGKPGTPEENEGIRAFILVDEFVIGRDEKKADLILPDPGIGRLHARILKRAGSFFISDLGSKNGTCLNGRRLLKNTECLLPDQCLLQFANHAFYFQAD